MPSQPRATQTKLLRLLREAFLFLVVGVPAFIVAIPLNWALVEHLHVWKPLSYAFVLVIQVSINFFLCRRFVFTPSATKSIGRQYAEFMGSVSIFRGGDFLLYSILTSWIDARHPAFTEAYPQYYITIQILNVIVFSLAKFIFCKKAIEGTK
ncbi:MAG: GtrA family protein [Kiritimatiellia bacterium]|jgi:putative flippase GtrA